LEEGPEWKEGMKNVADVCYRLSCQGQGVMGIYVSSNVLRRHDLYTSAAATCIIVSVFQCNLMRAWRESGQPWDPLMEGFHWFVNNDNEAKSVNVWLASKSCTDSIASRR
jgi:hypothetical protein